MPSPHELPTAPERGQPGGQPGGPPQGAVEVTVSADAAPARAQRSQPPAAALLLATLCAVFLITWSATALAAQWPLPWPVALVLGLCAAALAAWALARLSPRASDTQRGVGSPADRAAGTPPAATDALQTPASHQVDDAAGSTGEGESFAYTVSHDLRAPIRVIEGFTRIVREDYGHLLDRVGNDHLDRVLGAAARMNHMIDALLALARLSSQPLSRQPVDLSRLAQHVLDDLCKHAPQREVQTRVTPGLVAQGDPTLLRLVLENLIGNAWKYSARREVAQIEFGVIAHDGHPAYFVSDNGAGFDMRFADRLFGPFQRLHSATEFQGTGVGLASVQRIVRRHGGDIWAEAEVDRGATFYFTLAR